MIVIGSNEKVRIERLIRGSVVHELVEKSPCPVIVLSAASSASVVTMLGRMPA